MTGTPSSRNSMRPSTSALATRANTTCSSANTLAATSLKGMESVERRVRGGVERRRTAFTTRTRSYGKQSHLRRVRWHHRDNPLRDDLPVVELLVHEVHRGAGEPRAAVHDRGVDVVAVHAFAAERGKQRGVDVEHLIRVHGAKHPTSGWSQKASGASGSKPRGGRRETRSPREGTARAARARSYGDQ
eukprot:29307-Pelagococcus_subviridis.AAC.2